MLASLFFNFPAVPNPFPNHFAAGFIGGADAAVDNVGDDVVGAADDAGGVASHGNGF